MRNEWLLTHEKRITLTKEKNNTHKQRKLPNDERPVKESNEHETHFPKISTNDKKNGIFRSSYVCGARVYANHARFILCQRHSLFMITRTNNANYLMMSVQSKDQPGMNRIFDGYYTTDANINDIRRRMHHSCDRAFINVIRFSCLKRHSPLMRWPMRPRVTEPLPSQHHYRWYHNFSQ